MAKALFRGRQIFKFGLVKKKIVRKIKNSACVQPNGSRSFSALLSLYNNVASKTKNKWINLQLRVHLIILKM
jgi:hypothetical protein